MRPHKHLSLEQAPELLKIVDEQFIVLCDNALAHTEEPNIGNQGQLLSFPSTRHILTRAKWLAPV